jgi:AcrR family transcriptional regulator
VSRRDELLDVLADHVQHSGLEEPSLRELAEAAGVPHITLIHHFGSRSELMAEIFGRINERTSGLASLQPGASYQERLATMWATLTGAGHREVWATFFELLGSALRAPEQHREFLNHTATDWTVPLMAELIEAGFGGADAARTATFVVAAVRGLVIDSLAGGDPERINGAFDLLMGIVTDVTSR